MIQAVRIIMVVSVSIDLLLSNLSCGERLRRLRYGSRCLAALSVFPGKENQDHGCSERNRSCAELIQQLEQAAYFMAEKKAEFEIEDRIKQ